MHNCLAFHNVVCRGKLLVSDSSSDQVTQRRHLCPHVGHVNQNNGTVIWFVCNVVRHADLTTAVSVACCLLLAAESIRRLQSGHKEILWRRTWRKIGFGQSFLLAGKNSRDEKRRGKADDGMGWKLKWWAGEEYQGQMRGNKNSSRMMNGWKDELPAIVDPKCQPYFLTSRRGRGEKRV